MIKINFCDRSLSIVICCCLSAVCFKGPVYHWLEVDETWQNILCIKLYQLFYSILSRLKIALATQRKICSLLVKKNRMSTVLKCTEQQDIAVSLSRFESYAPLWSLLESLNGQWYCNDIIGVTYFIWTFEKSISQEL